MDVTRVELRSERPGDRAHIHALIDDAFRDMPFSEGDEADLVDVLRAQGALVVSLIAELDGTLVGQITFFPAFPADGSPGWYALGPVAVTPRLQRSGIGSKLIRAGLERITELGGAGCILTGDPAYYPRFGFEPAPANAPPEEPAEYFMLKVLRGERPRCTIAFHAAFHPVFDPEFDPEA